MNGATSLALARRLRDPRYAERWFVGRGIDIGAGPDPLSGYTWPHASIRTWDMQDGDAELMLGVDDATYDFVYSSHCLEHLSDTTWAMMRWVDILKPGGYLILVVPDFEMYERGIWPSRIQPRGHRHFFKWRDILEKIPYDLELEKAERLTDGFDPTLPVEVDQTTAPHNAECGIEVIARKR